MQPFQFGIAHEPLYGVYHPPSSKSANSAAVLLCPPLGHEQQQTHWAYKQLANRLSKLGFAVLRFDYFGTGNASGSTSEGHIKRWQDDIYLAGETLRQRSGTTQLVTIGLRMGATLSALASARLQPDQLILWDPVLSGKEYLSELQRLHQIKLQRMRRINEFPPQRNPLDLMGYIFSSRLLEEMERLDLTTSPLHYCSQLILFIDEIHAPHQQWIQQLRLQGHSPILNTISDAPDWSDLDIMEAALLPNKTISQITQQLRFARS